MDEDAQQMLTSEVMFSVRGAHRSSLHGREQETLFTFSCPSHVLPKSAAKRESAEAVEYDSDGDLVVRRRRAEDADELCEEMEVQIRLFHWNSSTVADVGRQVWRGALYLADFFLSGAVVTERETLFEIGCGCGLTAIVAAMCDVGSVVASDLEPFLDLAKKNLNVNGALLPRGRRVDVIPFDVIEDVANVPDALRSATLVYGADVVYDNDLSAAIATLMESVLIANPTLKRRRFLFSVEKRFVFTIKDLRTVAHNFDHFMSKLREKLIDDDSRVRNVYDVEVEVMTGDKVVQRFCYERTPDVVLIMIEARLKRTSL